MIMDVSSCLESSFVGSGRNALMSRSPPGPGAGVKDMSLLESHEFLVPDVCLEHVWEEEEQLKNTRFVFFTSAVSLCMIT